MTTEDHAALVALGRKMASTQRLHARCSRARCTSPTATRSTGPTAASTSSCTRSRCTLEHAQVSSTARFYPPDEIIGPQTERNKDAILYLIEAAGCPYSVIGKTGQNCGPLFDDFETAGGWVTNPLGTDTATRGAWQRADPQATTRQAGTVASGSRGARHRRGGRRHANTYDVEAASRSIRSPRDRLPGDGRLADVPLLLRPQLELVVGGLLPRLRRDAADGTGRW